MGSSNNCGFVGVYHSRIDGRSSDLYSDISHERETVEIHDVYTRPPSLQNQAGKNASLSLNLGHLVHSYGTFSVPLFTFRLNRFCIIDTLP